MQALMTVSDRIRACLVKAEQEGLSINRFFLGRKELDCLAEWADQPTADMIYAARELNCPLHYAGTEIYPIDRQTYFSYEVEEPSFLEV